MENFHRKLEQHNKLLCPFPATFRSYQLMDDVVNLYHTLSCLPILLIFSKQTPDIIPVNIMVYLQNRFFQSTTEISLSHQKKKKNQCLFSVIKYLFCTHFTYFHYHLGERNGNPLQYSGLENPMDRGACPWATVHGVTESQTQLRD